MSKKCVKSSQKLAALYGFVNYLEPEERKLIFNSMIKSHFTYYPLVWVFCSRTTNNLINKTHERSLRLILNDQESGFVEVLRENNGITNCQKNIQILLTAVFKTNKNLAPPIMEGIFNARPNNCHLINFQELVTEKKEITVKNGHGSISYRAPQLWSLLYEEIKSLTYLGNFKKVIKNWTCDKCPCRLSK